MRRSVGYHRSIGIVRFSCPTDLVRELALASGIDAAVETGTFRAEGTLALREAVSRVWSVELDDDLYQRAVRRYGEKPGLTFVHGSSGQVLGELAAVIDEPVIFWLDAHGGMAVMASDDVFNPAGGATQCPLLQELKAARTFRHWDKSVILIDDARGFLGPLPDHKAGDWPSLLEIIDFLRDDCDRYITILDDVLIAVPPSLQDVIGRWWLEQVRTREGRDGFQQNIWEAYNPKPRVAFRMLVKSVTPMSVRKAYERVR